MAPLKSFLLDLHFASGSDPLNKKKKKRKDQRVKYSSELLYAIQTGYEKNEGELNQNGPGNKMASWKRHPRLGTERIFLPSLGFFYITRTPLSSYAGHMDTSSRMSAA